MMLDELFTFVFLSILVLSTIIGTIITLNTMKFESKREKIEATGAGVVLIVFLIVIEILVHMAMIGIL